MEVDIYNFGGNAGTLGGRRLDLVRLEVSLRSFEFLVANVGSTVPVSIGCELRTISDQSTNYIPSKRRRGRHGQDKEDSTELHLASGKLGKERIDDDWTFCFLTTTFYTQEIILRYAF